MEAAAKEAAAGSAAARLEPRAGMRVEVAEVEAAEVEAAEAVAAAEAEAAEAAEVKAATGAETGVATPSWSSADVAATAGLTLLAPLPLPEP